MKLTVWFFYYSEIVGGIAINEAFSSYCLECVITMDLSYIKVGISQLFLRGYYSNLNIIIMYNLKDWHTIWSNISTSEQ